MNEKLYAIIKCEVVISALLDIDYVFMIENCTATFIADKKMVGIGLASEIVIKFSDADFLADILYRLIIDGRIYNSGEALFWYSKRGYSFLTKEDCIDKGGI
jgi:hypothetical protein